MRFGFFRIWRWPAVLAVLMIFGLLSALLGQGGVWWVLSWGVLAIPLLVIVAAWQKRRRPVDSRP
ncbi:MAG: hypothetical protein EKK36_00310 [Bradyrhizobiaceae bacterium]|nr:MAG: hypothetical protein EKK36_00310 [Bradyrhizobiaceae bacterium]